MVKMSELRTADKLAAEECVARHCARSTNAHCFTQRGGHQGHRYRVDNGLSHKQPLARRLGISQPAIARLEAGGHETSLAMLARLARGLGTDFSIDITPSSLELTDAR